jgi:hypothetical protein
MQCAQSDDRPRHAGLRPESADTQTEKGEYNHRSIQAPTRVTVTMPAEGAVLLLVG